MMHKDQVLRVLRQHKQALAIKYGVTCLGIFGPVARDEGAGTAEPGEAPLLCERMASRAQ